MTIEAQITFYCSEREPKVLNTVMRNGDHRKRQITGYHFQFMSWKRIVQLYHPRKFPIGGKVRQMAADLCRYAIENALSKTLEKGDALELRASYKAINNAEPDTRKETEIFG